MGLSMVAGERLQSVKIEFTRPGAVALEWLSAAIAELRQGDSLQPVTVIAPNYYAGRFALRHLARAGGSVNVRALRLSQLADSLASSDPQRQPRLTSALETAAIRAAVEQAGGPLRALEHHLSLHDALERLFREIRRQELDVDAELATRPGPVTTAAFETYRAFRRLCAPYDDPTDVRDRATRLPRAGRWPRELGALALLLPTQLDPADARLLAAAASVTPVRAGFARIGGPDEPGDEMSGRMATLLAAALGQDDTTAGSNSTRAVPSTDLRVFRAPDPSEEVREVIRRLAADLEHGVALHRVAILYRQTDPYGPLVRESLHLADLPWSALEGRRLPLTAPARALMSLLRLPERQFERGAVLEWIDVAPRLAPSGDQLPASVWERLSRAANVVRGVEQWQERLEGLAGDREADASRREAEGFAARAVALRREASQARLIANFMAELQAALDSRADGSPWSELVMWAARLWEHFACPAGGWAGHEDRAGSMVDETLRSLDVADQFEARRGPTFAEFIATLEAALAEQSLPEGRLGQGVVVGPVQSCTGLAFERVYILGLAEGAFPPPPPPDPFFPTAVYDPLRRRARQRAEERRAFLASVAAADGGCLTLCTPDSLGGRPAFPSRWMLELVSQKLFGGSSGSTLDAERFRSLRPSEQRWLRVVQSAEDGVARAEAAADLEDWRLREVARWRAEGRKLDRHPIALRDDIPVRRGLRLWRSRRGSRVTEFDGNVGAASDTRRLTQLIDGRRAISATSIESWAVCPFQHFLAHVLRVEPTELPEEGWTVDPLERGSLIHDILEAFFKRLRDVGRPTLDESYTAADHELLESLANDLLDRAHERGVTGHPLIWEATRKELLADLHAFLGEDERWRRDQRMTPTYFEQRFGMGDDGSWPAVELELDGARLRFRGVIDRVDLHDAARRAYVLDYKTGSITGYRDIEKDPVMAGKHIQLALYTRAIQAHLGADFEVDAAFWFATSRGEFKQIGPRHDPREIDDRLNRVLGLIGRGVRDGLFPATPDEDQQYGNCSRCDYDRICSASRYQDWERKHQADAARCEPILQLSLEKP